MWAVADYSYNCEYTFDEKDQLIRNLKIGSRGNNSGKFESPKGVAFDYNNCLYVAEYDLESWIQKFDASGNHLLQFGGKGAGNGQLDHPRGITVRNNKVFVAKYSNHRISVFHTNGQFSHIIGKGQLGQPYDVTVNTNNQLLVADANHDCIYIFTLDGNYVSKFSSYGSDKGQLSSPYGVTSDLCGFI